MGFSRQERWSGLPRLPQGDLPNPGFKPASPASPALAGRFFTDSAPWEAPKGYILLYLTTLKALRGLDIKKPCGCVDIAVPNLSHHAALHLPLQNQAQRMPRAYLV